MPQSAVSQRRRLASSSCCWPLSSHHWYKPVAPTRLDVVLAHSWHFSSCCISPAARRWARGTVQCSLLAFAALVLLLWLGSEYEQRQVVRASDTLGFYNKQATVCGIVRTRETGNATISNVTASSTTSGTAFTSPTSQPSFVRIESFSSVEEVAAAAANTSTEVSIVAHCGECGACSTPHDIRIYDETRNTLLVSSTQCAKHALIWGRKTATNCMAKNVGFTTECNECWIENIICDLRLCIFSCIWYGLFSQIDGGSNDGSSSSSSSGKALNPCTNCDEKRCGPAFVKCAGANRRRSGILSDIDRNQESEVCHAVTDEWWKDPDLQRQWEAQQEQEQQQQQHRKTVHDGPRLRRLS